MIALGWSMAPADWETHFLDFAVLFKGELAEVLMHGNRQIGGVLLDRRPLAVAGTQV